MLRNGFVLLLVFFFATFNTPNPISQHEIGNLSLPSEDDFRNIEATWQFKTTFCNRMKKRFLIAAKNRLFQEKFVEIELILQCVFLQTAAKLSNF